MGFGPNKTDDKKSDTGKASAATSNFVKSQGLDTFGNIFQDWDEDEGLVGNILGVVDNFDEWADNDAGQIANALAYMIPVLGQYRMATDIWDNGEQAFNAENDASDRWRSAGKMAGDIGLLALSLLPGLGGALGAGKALSKLASGGRRYAKGLSKAEVEASNWGKGLGLVKDANKNLVHPEFAKGGKFAEDIKAADQAAGTAGGWASGGRAAADAAQGQITQDIFNAMSPAAKAKLKMPTALPQNPPALADAMRAIQTAAQRSEILRTLPKSVLFDPRFQSIPGRLGARGIRALGLQQLNPIEYPWINQE